METIWHTLSGEEVVKKLNSHSQRGLSEEEAWQRQKKFGKNLLPQEKSFSRLRVFLHQLKSPLIYILIIAGFVTLFFKEWTDAIVILGAVFLNTLVGYFQENKANRALRALKKIVKIETQVIRESRELRLDSQDLVPGDIIVLTPGNKVPADGRLIEVDNLKINEAPLTGEWLTAKKTTKILSADTPLADRDNMVYMGGVIEEGKGKAVVTATGWRSEIGRVAKMVRETEEEKTPLQKKLAHFAKILGGVIVVICFFVFIEGILTGNSFLEMFTVSVALAVAAIPEGLPVALTVILALGMERILKRKGLVRKLVAAETLGSTSIACTDKTLTLTQGEMEVTETFTFEKKIKGKEKISWSDVFKREAVKDQILLMTIAALTNEAFVENPEKPYHLWRVRGRPTDKALLIAGAEVGLRKQELEEIYSKIKEIPFNPKNKFIATLVTSQPVFYQKRKEALKKAKISFIRDPLISGAKKILFIAGAPEKILKLSSYFQRGGKEEKLDQEIISKFNQELECLAGSGLRVIGVGYKKIFNFKSFNSNNNLEKEVRNLTLVGFIGLKDPLREGAKEAVLLCRKAGMRPIMVTGDHFLTAKIIARELGLRTEKENIIEGQELDKMSEEEFQKKIKKIEVYTRVEPHHKLRIIEGWQQLGEVVAMTGDGINDAPALKKADVGVALGSGTDVAKEVSDLILLTDDFSIIPAAVEEGRIIIDNLRKVITYLLSSSISEVMLISLTLPLGFPLPILAGQILWINLVEGVIPAFALASEPKEKDIMNRKPEGKEVPLLIKESRALIFIIGLISTFVLLLLFFWLFSQGRELAEIRTMIFACLTLESIFYIFSCRSLRRNLWQINPFSNKNLIAAWFFALIMLLLAIYFPPLQILLRTVSLTAQDWLIFGGIGVGTLILIEATKWYFISKERKKKPKN